MNSDIKKKIESLKKEILHHNKLYYDMDSPEIDDSDYDKLMLELKNLEERFPEFATQDSPTKTVGGTFAFNTFAPVEHKVQMGSLQDIFEIGDLYAFDKRIREEISSPVYVVEPKIDGLSVSLEYQNGIFVRGSTRGNGFIGEDVTENIRTISSVPQKLDMPIRFIEVRGEVYMPRNVFESIIEKQKMRGEKIFKNPRNAAAGSLRQKDPKITATRKMDIFVFNIQQLEIEGYHEIEAHKQSLDFLGNIGFNVISGYSVCENIEQVIQAVEEIGKNRANFEYDIDGAVVKIDGFSDRERIGSTSKFPKWAIAFKYPPEEKTTTLLSIEINIGRTGVLTPTAVFEPIQLSGSTVSRAVLHNEDFILQKDICIGDEILVRKAGDIIPEVVAVVKKSKDRIPYKFPNECPICKMPVTRDEGKSAVRCKNPDCSATLLQRITHFASRDAMNIDGFGEAVAESLINANLIKTPADLYSITTENLIPLERFAQKSASNLIDEIAKSKTNDLRRLIFALGIPEIGVRASDLLVEKFGNINKIINATLEEISEIEKFGDIMAKNVIDFFALPSNKELISNLEKFGVNMNGATSKRGNLFAEKTFVLTGTLPSLKRNEATQLITANGGKVSGSVSKKTSYVLSGEDSGSKLDKARTLGIPIITEEEFLQMINMKTT